MIDVSVDPWDPTLAQWADKVAFSVPMHTATRMVRELAAEIDTPICCYGLYAGMCDDIADVVIAGEYESALVDWVQRDAHPDAVQLGRAAATAGTALPARHLLPTLDRYTRLVDGDVTGLVGSVEASRGCAHRCRHCPVPVVYDGRVRVTDEAAVLADIEQLVAAGATHITFGDPDFLNAPLHSMRVVRAMHTRFPLLTFDCTVKVEHVLRHADLWPELAEAGCIFVVSAFESVNDAILERLDKGHTASDAARAVTLLRTHGIDVRPSFLPFTPWTTHDDVIALLDFVHEQDLVGSVDPVQYTIRLLLPRLATPRSSRPRALPRGVGRRPAHLRVARGRPVGRRAACGDRRNRRNGHRRRRAGHRHLRKGARGRRCAAGRPRHRPARPAPPERELVLLRRAHRGAGGAAQILTNARYTSHSGSRRAIIWISWVSTAAETAPWNSSSHWPSPV